MKYNDRLYPHPVLGINNNITGEFSITMKVSTSSKSIFIEASYFLLNNDIINLIKSKKAVYCIQLYCSSTFYREVFKSSSPIQRFEIDSHEINERVEVHFFICTDVSISKYDNQGFSNEFKNYTFDLDKGDILAYGGKGYFYANKTNEELKSVSSFMNIDCSEKDNYPMYNDYDNDKITILLSTPDYLNYQIIKNNKNASIIHSSIVLPALAEAIRFIEEENNIDYKDKKWYDLLIRLITQFESSDPLQTAQRILEMPVNRSLLTLSEMVG